MTARPTRVSNIGDISEAHYTLDLMRPKLLTAVTLALLGCDSAAERFVELMSGRETNRVVLATQPLMLSEVPTTLTSPEPMKVLGEWTSLCLVLRDGVPLQPMKQMDQVFANALGGAKVKTTVVLGDGSRVTLNEPMQGWARSGRVLSQNELSACASASCGVRLPTGAVVRSVELSATPQLQVRGVYWESQLGVNEKRQAAEPSKVAQDSPSQSKCGAS